MKEIKLTSGKVLRITLSPFTLAKDLFQALLKELRGVPFHPSEDQFEDFYKNIFTSSFSSKEVERLLWGCLSRCTYGPGNVDDPKIDESTFDDEEARGDYIEICIAVARENVLPFVKSLYAEYRKLTEKPATKSTQG